MSHAAPTPSMMVPAMDPRPGAANVSVPKNGIGIAFWMAGVPGTPLSVNVAPPRRIAPGMRRLGVFAARNSATATGYDANTTTNTETPP